MAQSEKEVVIVTGSSGLIGTRLVESLGQRFQVIGFDKVGNPFPDERVECVCK